MGVFAELKERRQYEREHLSLLKTLEDFDLIQEIGYHQECGKQITLKLLFLQNIGSVATVQRRLSRLKRLGLVQHNRTDGDKRSVKLTLSAEVMAVYARLGSVRRRARQSSELSISS
jgi:hypothetical protein